MAPLRAEDLKVGAQCLYRNAQGSLTEAEIIGIDRSLHPPSVGIRVDGRERETELDRLRTLDEISSEKTDLVAKERVSNPAEEPVREPAKQSAGEPSKEKNQDAAKEPPTELGSEEPRATNEAARKSDNQAAGEPAQESKQSVKKPSGDPAKEAQGPVAQEAPTPSSQEPAKESGKESAKETADSAKGAKDEPQPPIPQQKLAPIHNPQEASGQASKPTLTSHSNGSPTPQPLAQDPETTAIPATPATTSPQTVASSKPESPSKPKTTEVPLAEPKQPARSLTSLPSATQQGNPQIPTAAASVSAAQHPVFAPQQAAALHPGQHPQFPNYSQFPEQPGQLQATGHPQQLQYAQQPGAYGYGYQYPYGYQQVPGYQHPYQQTAGLAIQPQKPEEHEINVPTVMARPRVEAVDEKEPKRVIPRVQLDQTDPTRVPKPADLDSEPNPEPEVLTVPTAPEFEADAAAVTEAITVLSPTTSTPAENPTPSAHPEIVLPTSGPMVAQPEHRAPKLVNTQSQPLPDSDDEDAAMVAVPVTPEAPGVQEDSLDSEAQAMLAETQSLGESPKTTMAGVDPGSLPSVAGGEPPVDKKSVDGISVAVRARAEVVDEKATKVEVPRIQPLDEGSFKIPSVLPAAPDAGVASKSSIPTAHASVPSSAVPAKEPSLAPTPAPAKTTRPVASSSAGAAPRRPPANGHWQPPQHLISTKDMVTAENHTRSALQALKFDDIAEAVEKMKAALELLGN